MPRYRKQPVEIEAWRFFMGTTVPDGADIRIREGDSSNVWEVYDRLHNVWVPFADGDYVIKGLKGEFYPCKPEVFHESYQAVERVKRAYSVAEVQDQLDPVLIALCEAAESWDEVERLIRRLLGKVPYPPFTTEDALLYATRHWSMIRGATGERVQ